MFLFDQVLIKGYFQVYMVVEKKYFSCQYLEFIKRNHSRGRGPWVPQEIYAFCLLHYIKLIITTDFMKCFLIDLTVHTGTAGTTWLMFGLDSMCRQDERGALVPEEPRHCSRHLPLCGALQSQAPLRVHPQPGKLILPRNSLTAYSNLYRTYVLCK